MPKIQHVDHDARLEKILNQLGNAAGNDTEIDALRELLWAAFETIPKDSLPHFFSKISSTSLVRTNRT